MIYIQSFIGWTDLQILGAVLLAFICRLPTNEACVRFFVALIGYLIDKDLYRNNSKDAANL